MAVDEEMTAEYDGEERRHDGIGDTSKGRRPADPEWEKVRALTALKKAFGLWGSLAVLILSLMIFISNVVGSAMSSREKGSEADKELMKAMLDQAAEDRKQASEDRKDLVKAIDRTGDAVNSMKEIMSNLLTVSRMKAGDPFVDPLPLAPKVEKPSPPKTLRK